jgi:aerobic carbon-monoxide dehydrogenase medium subunit
MAGDSASTDKEVMAMSAAAFEYHTPATLQEAIALLKQYDGEAKILAGGHSLLPIMNLRLAQPKALIDIGKIPGLSGIREENGAIVIGAMTTHYQVESSSLLKQEVPILPETAAVIGDVQVRNRGTIGGSIAHADPAGDLPAAAVALDLQLKAIGPSGERTLNAREFFVDILTTALQADEILTEIRVPAMAPRTGSAYEKFPNPASRYAIVGAAAVVTVDGNGVCQKASVGLNGITGKPVAAVGVEQALVGKPVNEQTIQEASAKAADGLEPLGDIFASAPYRAHLARVYTKRALTRARGRV